MAFQFEFDPLHQIIRIMFSEVVTEDDLMSFYRMAALLVQRLDPQAAVVDFTSVNSFDISVEFMRSLAALPPAIPQPERPRVVVAPADYVFGLARLFAVEGEATRPNFHVVRSAQQAWAILEVQKPEFTAISQALDSRRDGLST